MLTNFIVTWSGLIFPLLGFAGAIAWRFPYTYKQRIGPMFGLLILVTIIFAIGWNFGSITSESTITGVENGVAQQRSSLNRPSFPFRLEDEAGAAYQARIAEYEELIRKRDEESARWDGASDAVKAAKKSIDNIQLGIIDFYWLIALFYYALLLSNIREWFEKVEERLSSKDSKEVKVIESNPDETK